MESVSFFSSMTNEQKDAIGHSLITVKYTKGQVIVNEGDRADSFYMIKEGVVSVEKGG
jgi:cGMP-dependent protein kinase